MGVVFRARDAKLGREVALKFLVHAAEADGNQRRRFEREARSLAALNHPGICQIHDLDEADGIPYLVLEWVRGRPLTEAGLTSPLATDQFLDVVTGIADALAAAHSCGIIHRDLKPANVLITEEGAVKLVDFGLAKLLDSSQDITQTTGTVGTVAYMSPEQARGNELEASSDVFSFGILAYELLTGSRPFPGQALAEVVSAILNADHVPLARHRPELPDDIIALVNRCLQKHPEDRFADGGELAQAVRRLGTGSAPTRAMQSVPSLSRSPTDALQQDVRFCTTSDGVRIAYSVVGSGPPLVRVLGHFTHLEMEWEWTDLRRFWQRMAERHSVVRYDGRGIGLSDPYEGDFTEESRQLDLGAVLDAVGAEKAVLLGISEGGWAAATYAIDHPDRITHLILYGAYCRGARARPGYDAEEDQALMTLIRKGWGRDSAMFRQVFTSQFFTDEADPGLIAHFNELQRVSADPETAARYEESCHARGDGRGFLQQVSTPTLVVHCREDRVIPADEGRLLASIIPGARLVQLPSGTHYFPTEPAIVAKVGDAIDSFLEQKGPGRKPRSPR